MKKPQRPRAHPANDVHDELILEADPSVTVESGNFYAVIGGSRQRAAGAEHIVRAALESIAYQSEDVISAMREDTGKSINALKADGGASANNLLMQFQADISNLNVIRPAQTEATAAGAAMLAGKAVGFCQSPFSGKSSVTVFKSDMTPDRREKLLNGWRRAVKSCLLSEEDL